MKYPNFNKTVILLLILSIVACQSDYTKLVKNELSSGKKNDSIFYNLRFGNTKNEFFRISTLMSLRKETADTVGKLEHVILQHQKVTILILQKNDVTYYVSINRKEKGLEKIISLIKKTV